MKEAESPYKQTVIAPAEKERSSKDHDKRSSHLRGRPYTNAEHVRAALPHTTGPTFTQRPYGIPTGGTPLFANGAPYASYANSYGEHDRPNRSRDRPGIDRVTPTRW